MTATLRGMPSPVALAAVEADDHERKARCLLRFAALARALHDEQGARLRLDEAAEHQARADALRARLP